MSPVRKAEMIHHVRIEGENHLWTGSCARKGKHFEVSLHWPDMIILLNLHHSVNKFAYELHFK